MGNLFYMTLCFSFASFRILSSSYIFHLMIIVYLSVYFFGFMFFGTLFSFYTCISVSFFMFGKFSGIISSNTFLSFFHFSSSGTPVIQMLMRLMFSSDQIRSVAQSCLTLCDPMNHSTPGLPVHHQFPEFTQTHVHRVSDAIQSSHPLSSPSPPAFNPSHHQSLFQ